MKGTAVLEIEVFFTQPNGAAGSFIDTRRVLTRDLASEIRSVYRCLTQGYVHRNGDDEYRMIPPGAITEIYANVKRGA